MMSVCNIPQSKLPDLHFKSFFKDIGYIVQSKSYLRMQIHFQADLMLKYLFSKFVLEKTVLIVDETQINRQKFFHVLAGSFIEPKAIYLVKNKVI